MIPVQVPQQHRPSFPVCTHNKTTLVGEGLHVLNPGIEEAIRRRQASILIAGAERQIAAGAQALAINLGPGKSMAELTPWVVGSIAEAVDVPLFLSSGVTAMDMLLEKYGSRITINAVTANPDLLVDHLDTARRYATNLVVLLVRPGLVPAGIDDRLQLASEVIGKAMETGLPLEQLYLDPVINCRPDPLSWQVSRGMPDIHPVTETIACIRDLHQGIRTIVALGNGTPEPGGEKKSALQGRMLHLLVRAGVDAVILNCQDSSLMEAANRLAGRQTGQIRRTGLNRLDARIC